MTFKYTALTKDGVKVNGVLDAPDQYAAAARIKAQYPVIEKLDPVNEKTSFLSQDLQRKVDEKALSVMCSQFAIMLSSGVNIALCIKMIANQTQDKALKKMLEKSAVDVSQGASVASSFEKNCPILPVTFIETIRAGELSGTMEDSFKTLETYYSKSYQLAQKIKQALAYPIFVLIVAIVVLFVIMIKVVPTLTNVFGELGGELPAITQFLINTSKFFGKWWWLILGVMLILVIVGLLFSRTPKGKEFFGNLELKMPVLGEINQLNASAEFANTMSALLQAGLGVGNALSVTSKVLRSYILANQVREMVDRVEAGYKVGDSIRKTDFPLILQEMTAIGEDTGELEKTLEVIGAYYANEADYAIQKAISKLEPTILVFLAIFAGFIVIAIYMPMFTMYDLM